MFDQDLNNPLFHSFVPVPGIKITTHGNLQRTLEVITKALQICLEIFGLRQRRSQDQRKHLRWRSLQQ